MKRRQRGRGEDGGAIIEMALVLPVLLGLILGCFQLMLVFYSYLSVLYGARDVARWLAVHPDTVDASVVSMAQSQMPPDLKSANLTLTITPSCTSLDSSGLCASRPRGTEVALSFKYDVTSLFYLPHPAGMSVFLPTYTLNFMTEVN